MIFTPRNSLVWLAVLAGLPAFGSSVGGIQNFRQVDTHIYRGGQPDREGFAYLSKLGVKTILDLRESGTRSSWEGRIVTALGMKYVNVPMTGLRPPTADQISRILSMLEDSATGAVYVHCKRGADRTGAVIAAYRIDHDNWDNARALEEALSNGMRFFQWPRQHFIREFQPLAKSKPSAPSAPVASAPAAVVAAPALAK